MHPAPPPVTSEAMDDTPTQASYEPGAVAAAQQRLDDLETAPLDEHPAIFDDVQRQLHEALCDLDDG